MILEWTLENFKSIKGPQTLQFAPLTILAGANSSGKSTVLQSILLVSQTLSSSRRDRHLILNGELVRLGDWSDVVHRERRRTHHVGIGFKLARSSRGRLRARPRAYARVHLPERYERIRAVEVSADFEPSRATPRGEIREPLLRKLRETVDMSAAEHGSGKERSAGLTIRRRHKVPEQAERVLERRPADDAALPYETTVQGVEIPIPSILRGEAPPSRLDGTLLEHFLPAQFLFMIDARHDLIGALDSVFVEPLPVGETVSARRYLRMLRVELPGDLLALLRAEFRDFPHGDEVAGVSNIQSLHEWIRKTVGRNSEELDKLQKHISPVYRNWAQEYLRSTAPDYQPRIFPMPDPFDDAADLVAMELGASLGYLGPLRDDPKSVYELPPSGDPSDVGLKGEYTAAVLDTFRKRSVSYCRPGDSVPVTEPLMDAVTAWLRHFALLESVTTQPAGKLGHSIFVRTHSVPGDQDLTNVGVGVSQVLPILVMSLLADEGSTLIFEQPEIHLHPRVQSLLADFFISLIATGKQCIVETHSEYLINRVRLRVAEDAASTLRDKLSVYFVEKPGTESVFRRVQINEYGAIPEWPRGFFDEGPSEAERIMSASMARGTRREQAT